MLSLAFFPVLAGGLVLFFVIERVESAVLGLFRGKGGDGPSFLVSCFEVSLQTLFALAYSCLSVCSGVFGAAVSALSLLFIGSVLYVLYSQSPWAWRSWA